MGRLGWTDFVMVGVFIAYCLFCYAVSWSMRNRKDR